MINFEQNGNFDQKMLLIKYFKDLYYFISTLGISPVIKATELADVTKIPDKLTMMSYLSQVYDCFRREIPHNQQSMEGKTQVFSTPGTGENGTPRG